MFVFCFVFIHVSFSVVIISKKRKKLRIVHLLRVGRQAIKSIYYVLFGKVVTRKDRKKKMRKWPNLWDTQKNKINKSLKAIPEIQTCSQEHVSQKKAPHETFF